mmetsp:Transcript_9822/g.23723  ORF Transcript_9822/g.23723 Transcript_9822/m.23723 type:complete len:88 (-) Transcript_9822:563-826(-)
MMVMVELLLERRAEGLVSIDSSIQGHEGQQLHYNSGQQCPPAHRCGQSHYTADKKEKGGHNAKRGMTFGLCCARVTQHNVGKQQDKG